MADLNLIVTPPAKTRVTASSADPAVVRAMVKQIKPGTFVTDGKEYPNRQEASKASSVYRRALTVASGIESHKFVLTIWGTNGKDDTPLAADKPGVWKFAYTTDPNRAKRARKPKA